MKGEFLATLKAAIREYFNPRQRDLDDDERQSVDEATAARTRWVRDHRRGFSDDGEWR